LERTSLAEADCPVARAVDLIGEWGSFLIVREALHGSCRFEQFHVNLEMSRNLLTSRLKKLVSGGVLERKPLQKGGKRLQYALTPMGADLFTTMTALRQWGERWLVGRRSFTHELLETATSNPIPPLGVRSKSGKPLVYTDVFLKPLRKGGTKKAASRGRKKASA
jgi:DNA-binding HxlR family transcriptional regulator